VHRHLLDAPVLQLLEDRRPHLGRISPTANCERSVQRLQIKKNEIGEIAPKIFTNWILVEFQK
jgi:hypothetical protein